LLLLPLSSLRAAAGILWRTSLLSALLLSRGWTRLLGLVVLLLGLPLPLLLAAALHLQMVWYAHGMQ
jgi:hypothetical protein